MSARRQDPHRPQLAARRVPAATTSSQSAKAAVSHPQDFGHARRELPTEARRDQERDCVGDAKSATSVRSPPSLDPDDGYAAIKLSIPRSKKPILNSRL